MTLRPENNPAYWPLLLTDALYLLPHELQQQQANQELSGQLEAAAHGADTPDNSALAHPAAAIASLKINDKAETRAQGSPRHDLLWGSLQRGILILVDYPEHQLIERTDGLFLVEILKAVGFDFKEVATLNIHRCKTDTDWDHVRNLGYTHLISFGVRRPELTFNFQDPDYQAHSITGKIILPVENLGLIRTDVNRKKRLWNLLKQVFV